MGEGAYVHEPLLHQAALCAGFPLSSTHQGVLAMCWIPTVQHTPGSASRCSQVGALLATLPVMKKCLGQALNGEGVLFLS